MCDSVVVVRPGRVLFAKNSDRDPNEAQRLEFRPAAEYAPGTMLRCTWNSIAQARRTHAVMLSRPFWMWGAEMGTNEHGVVVGNEAVFTDQPHEPDGLTGMDLVRLALERGATAEEAAEVIRVLIIRHGQGGRAGYDHPGFQYHNSFLLADHRGALVLETAGRETALERVTEGVRAISNGLTLPALRPRADGLRSAVAHCRRRRARVEALARLAHSPADLAWVLRDHGPGREQPRYSRLNGAMDAPCMHYGGYLAGSQTVSSWISELRPEGADHWSTGCAAPCLALFRPLPFGVAPPAGSPGGHDDGESLWWRFEALHRLLLRDLSGTEALTRQRNGLEEAAFAHPEPWQEHWHRADQWLDRWLAEFQANPSRETRPRWLASLWARQRATAEAGDRLPPVDRS